jgi:hypothetical protein
MSKRPALIAKKPKSTKVTKAAVDIANIKYMGKNEPFFSKAPDDVEFARALNWFHTMMDVNDARSSIKEYLKNMARTTDIKTFSRVHDSNLSLTACWIARLISRGSLVQENSREFLEKKIVSMLSKAKVSTPEVETTSKSSIQDKIREKSMDIIGNIEELIDIGEPFVIYDWLKSNEVPALYANDIQRHYAPVLSELIEAYEGTCPQLNEAYKHFTKKKLAQRINFFSNLLEDCDRYANNTKKARAPRKPKTISMEKRLKNLKYQKEDQIFKLNSVSPEKIIGAQELWCFNTKYKVLTVFRALDRGGLGVNRSSITGFDEKTSISRGTGRKTESIVQNVLKGGKLVLRKLMDELKTQKNLQERINENTVLLRIVS